MINLFLMTCFTLQSCNINSLSKVLLIKALLVLTFEYLLYTYVPSLHYSASAFEKKSWYSNSNPMFVMDWVTKIGFLNVHDFLISN